MKIFGVEFTEEDIRSIGRLFKEGFSRLVIPRNKKNKIGIVVAIKTENDKEKIRLENDLLSELEKHLKESSLGSTFYILRYPEFLSKKISNFENARQYLDKSKAHLIVFGHLAERNFNGSNNYVFRLHGIVRHLQTSPEIKEGLADDFLHALPNRIIFPEIGEILGFDFTADLLGYTVKLIIGSAALISQDSELSTQLLKELHKELLSKRSTPILREILTRTSKRLANSLNLKVDQLYLQFVETRNTDYLYQAKSYAEELISLDPDNSSAIATLSILLFKEGKIEESIELLKAKEQSLGPSPVFKYNIGFLYACMGKIDQALEMYRKANYTEVPGRILNELEIFISEEIENNPRLVQLVFFRGLINYKVKTDYLLAREDFISFLGNPESSNFPRLSELAEKYLSEITDSVGSDKIAV